MLHLCVEEARHSQRQHVKTNPQKQMKLADDKIFLPIIFLPYAFAVAGSQRKATLHRHEKVFVQKYPLGHF